MPILIRTIIRAATVAVALVGYVYLYPLVIETDDAGGADIGFGLIAFALLFLGAGVWGLVDGFRWPVTQTLAVWALASVIIAVGFLAVSSIHEADSSAGAIGLFRGDLELIPFIFFLLAIPAATGTGVGAAIRSTVRPANPETTTASDR